MASTHTHASGSGEDFLKGFANQGIREQIYLFQAKTNDPLLDNCLHRVAHEGADPATIASYLENFPRFTSQEDPVVINKAVELGAAYRAQYVS